LLVGQAFGQLQRAAVQGDQRHLMPQRVVHVLRDPSPLAQPRLVGDDAVLTLALLCAQALVAPDPPRQHRCHELEHRHRVPVPERVGRTPERHRKAGEGHCDEHPQCKGDRGHQPAGRVGQHDHRQHHPTAAAGA
jgi:hypothetical protein